MSELFIELYSEEIPVNFFVLIEHEIKKIMKDNFFNDSLCQNFCKIYTTSCRIIICANISIKQEHYNILENTILKSLNAISTSFTKNIRWNNNVKDKWISPLRNILCLFDGKVINFEFCNLKSNNFTFGHKILIGLDKKIEIKNFDDYKVKMKENFVIFDQNERQQIIIDKLIDIENKFNFSILTDFTCNFKDDLIQEIVNSLEYPNILIGEFKEEFSKLPDIVIINIISNKYKCFCITKNSTNILSNKYLFFVDTKISNNNQNIIVNFNEVINSQLSLINLELIKYLSENIEMKINKLKSVSYYKDFGTLYDKVERLIELSKFICLWVPHCDLINIEDAAKLCKIDIASNIVKENQDLKGYLSAYYAKMNNYPEIVCKGIEEYYEPRNLCEKIPETNIGKILSIAGRVDNIVTLFIANKETTSSKDPYGIRKNITSVIKIIVEGNIITPVNILVHKSISLFKTDIYKKNNNSKISIKQQIIDIENNIIDLFKQRFVSYLITCNCNINIINSILNLKRKNKEKKILNLNIIYNKILKIDDYIKNNEKKFLEIKNTYKRLNNILFDYEKKDLISILEKFFNKKYFKNEQEKNMDKKIKEIKKNINKEIKIQNYDACFELLYEFTFLVDKYFKNNLIKTINIKKTNSRLFLIYKIKNIFDSLLNFSNLNNYLAIKK